MKVTATTISEYLAALPPERRAVLQKVRSVIKKHLPNGYKEMLQYGMIGYSVPLSLYPKGYGGDHKTPLPYVGLAAQKNFYAVYLMGVYGNKEFNEWFVSEYKKTGKKLDMGKSCVRFKKLENLPLELIGKAVAKISVKQWIAIYDAARSKK